MDLNTPIGKLPRIGPQYQKKLLRLGIETTGDLLFHFPHRYEDFSNIVSISQIKPLENCCIQGEITEIKNIRTWKKRMILTQAVIHDDSGSIKVTWFNQPYLADVFREGDFACLAGKTALRGKELYLSSPVYEKISSAEYQNKDSELIHTGRLVPVYPGTEKLSSRWLRMIIRPLLERLKNSVSEPLPERIVKEHNFLPIQKAIWQIHFPDSLEMANIARQRFAFEDLLYLSLIIGKERQKIAKENAVAIPLDIELIKGFLQSLPFQLTDSQKKSAWQILKDMERPRPMNRLLEGDVGSGKTVVATMAILNAVKAGHQAALMAPTEILAKQHFKTINNLLEKFYFKIGLLTGSENMFMNEKITRKELLNKTLKGKVDILIGTHALIQKEVKFNNLALAVVDEQHRFGVDQRASLCRANGEKTKMTHLLSMTATPIPRTLSLTIYGDLDLSLITEMPKGRKKIITEIVPQEKRQEAYDFIKKEIKAGRQAFVICPRIDSYKTEDKDLIQEIVSPRVLSWAEVKAVKEEYEKLSKNIFPDLNIAMLHGKMKPKEKEKIMKDFKEKKADVLVSTSVVEVGIDIPNATIMMIEGADRFGLAQLHQFRGRVGRSEHQSYCLLFSELPARTTKLRLKALITAENGFELAEKDLEIRGPGDFIGARQWGIPDIAMASLKDIVLVEKAKNSAKEILKEDPQLKKYPLLKQRVEGFGKRIHLE